MRAEPAVAAPRRRRRLVIAAAAAVVASAWLIDAHPSALLDPSARASVGRFLRGLYPPDLSWTFLAVVARAAGRTIAIATAGTALAVLVALPLALLATGTLFRRGPLVDGAPGSPARLALAAASTAARAALGALRAVPDFLWALVFVVGFGLGPLAGVVALAVSYGGVLGHVFADLFEDVDPRPLGALRATGATRGQIFLFGIWPQARASVLGYALYTFECNVRAATVLGLVGAGGLGYEIALSMRLLEYGQIVTLVAALLALQWIAEAASTALRRTLRANAPPGALGHRRASRGAPGRAARAVAVLATAAAVVACAVEIGLFDGGVFDGGAGARIARFARGLIPPEVSPSFLSTLVRPAAQTVAISVIGTLLGVLLGAPLGIAAAAPDPEADRAAGGERWRRRAARRLCVVTLALLRAVPEALWVLVFILAVGIGPFAGALALGAHTAGVLGKLYAQTLEEVSPLPLRGLRATGASPLQILVWGMWPEARRTLISYTLLRWEMNLRASTVVGLAGGGGIGIALYNNVQLGFYPEVATLIIAIAVPVAAMGWLGDRIRRQLGTA